MKRALIGLLGLAVLLTPLPGGATHNPTDVHSDNVKHVTTWDDAGTYRAGSDIAFWRNTAIFGKFNGGFRLMNIKKPKNIFEIGEFTCNGSQSDVSIWKNLAFISVDATMASDACNADPASQAQILAGTHWEGLRVISIADKQAPQQIATVATDCGSHTHTLFPDLDHRDATGAKAPRLLVYVLSYPISGQGGECNAQTHRKISIVEVPLNNPTAAKVIATPSVGQTIGCHDVTYFPQRNLAGAACISESQLWDVSDPASPKILGRITNSEINIHHSAAFSWDGNTLVLGDELGGAVVAPGCQSSSSEGALWFYDVKNPAAPRKLSYFKIPQRDNSALCTAHNFNVVPLRGRRDILVSSWYNGGTTIVDFTLPELPKQIGYYIPRTPRKATTFSSYWYRGRIYVNNYEDGTQSRGIDIFQVKHKFTKRAIRLKYMNPQTQLPFRIPKKKRG